jgi:hypothetical protein
LHNIGTGLISALTEVVHAATNAPTAVGITTSTSLIFVVFILLPLQTSSRPDGLLVLGSGLLTSLLSRSSSVSYASPSAIPHPNMLSFATVATSFLLILQLVPFLQVVGSRMLVRINTLLK